MSRPEKYYARTADTRRVYPLQMAVGEAYPVEIDWGQMVGEYGSSVQDCSWQTDSGVVGIADADVDGSVTRATVSAVTDGVGMVVAVVTLTDDRVFSRWWYVRVTDPAAGAVTDYPS